MNWCKICIPILLFCFSCMGKEEQLREEIKMFQSRPVSLCVDKMLVLKDGRDTVVSRRDGVMRMVVYTDSTICSSCRLQNIHLWDDLLEEASYYEESLDFYFIFSPTRKDMDSFRLTMRTYAPDNIVYVDTLGLFAKQNPYLSSNPVMHTFLLDENNNVLLVGNPLENKKIKEMFWQIVEEKLGKRE